MANRKDVLSKYVRSSAKKARPVVQKSNSWMGNALRSVGFSAFDVLEELMPATIDVAKVTATTGKDIADNIRRARSQDRTLRNAIERNYYVGLGTKVFKNSLEDLKSGKFYNKERADKYFDDMNDDMMDFGEDFDFGEDSFDGSIYSSDGSAEASFRRRKGGNNEATQIVVNTDLGPDSAVVQATNYQTETTVNVGRAVVDSSKANTRATMVMLGGMRNEVNASLSAINENISTIATTLTDTVSKHATLSAKYYEDSIALQQQILAELQRQTPSTQVTNNTRTFKEYNNVMDILSSGGGVDPKAYMELVKKRFGNYVDSNMLLSQMKFMAGNKETLEMMAQNPLSFIPKAVAKTLIPNTVRSVITEFDNQLKETSIAALNQVSGLQRSNNPFLSAIGKIFGVQNKISLSSVDKSAYNKGATSWAGTDHQALTNVIPTLLRKIHASISGSEEIGFDYERGVFAKVRDIEKQAEKDKIYRETSGFSEYKSEFKDFLEKNAAASREERESFSEQFEKFISKLVLDSAGGRTFRLGGRDGKGGDDIAELLNSNSNDPAVKLIRAYLSGMEKDNKSKLTAFFGSKVQEQRASIDRQNKERQEDPIRYNTMYENTGLQTYKDANRKNNYTGTDSHLSYKTNRDPITGKKTLTDYVVGSKGGIGAGVIDKYGNNQTYYLREILKTLNTGIYVFPVGDSGSGGKRRRGGSGGPNANIRSAIEARATSVSTRMTTEIGDARRKEQSMERRSTYTDDKRQKDVDKGKINTNQEFTQDQIDLLGEAYQSEVNGQNPKKPGFVDRIMGKVPEDSGLGRILKRYQKLGQDSEKGLTTVFKKLDSALFQVVFGDPKGHYGFKAMFDKGLGTLKAGFFKFSTFLDNKILKPLDEALFGETGIFNKIKQSEFGKKVSEVFTNLTNKASTFLLGEKDGDGNRSGGIFSETANSLKDMGTQVKYAILGEKGPDGKALPLDQDNSVVGNLKRMFKNTSEKISNAMGIDNQSPKESLGTKIANGLDSAMDRIKERSSDWSNTVFGNGDTKEFVNQFRQDMKGQKGFIGASAVVGAVSGTVLGGHLGLLGSMFLPGGPVGGALLGAGIGIISKSTGLQDFLFGKEVTDADGNVSRTGGLITKDFQDFFKQNKVGIGVGAGAGLAASFGLLPSFFVPGGPIGGALIGGAISLATKSDAFQNLLYGAGGDEKNPTGGFMKKFKQIFGKDKDLKKLGLDAGIGAGVGLVGSFFLPGGPIIGALLGSAISVGTATDKFRNWFFGEEGEDGKRHGGIFNRFTGYVKDKIFDPLGKAVKITQNNILRFVEKNMVAPFMIALNPLIEEAKHVKTVVTDKVKDVFDGIKEKFHQHVTKPIGEAVERHILDPLKKAMHTFFGGLGKFIGNIISAPFKAMFGLGKGAKTAQEERAAKEKRSEVNNQYDADVVRLYGDESNMNLVEKGFNRIKKIKQLPEWLRAKGKRNDALRNIDAQKKANIQAYEDSLSERQSAIDAKYDAKDYAIRNGTKVSDSTIPAGTTAGIPATVFAKRAGLRPVEVFRLIRSGQLPYTKDEKGRYIVDGKLVSKFRGMGNDGGHKPPQSSTSTSQSTPHDTTTVSSNPTNVDTAPGTPVHVNAEQDTPNVRASREGRGSRTTVDAGSNRRRGRSGSDYSEYRDQLSGFIDRNTRNQGESTVSGMSDTSSTKKGKTYNTGSLVDKIQKDVSKITDSVYGQLNGVGSNINKIYKVLLKKLGLKDDDIKGENNKEYVGFLGRIRTALNRPLKAIGDLITAPFRAIGRVVNNIKDGFLNIGKGIGKAGKALVSGIGGIAKGLGGMLKELVKLPIDLLHTGLSAVRAALPAVGEALKEGVSLIGKGLNAAGSLLVSGVKGLGSAISGAAKGFGQMVGGAMSGVGNLLKSMGLIGADALKGIWKGMKFVGKGIAKGAGIVGKGLLSAPGKIIGAIRGKREGKGLFGRKGPMHVIVDSGVLDRVRKVSVVNRVKEVGEEGIGSLIGGSGGRGGKPLKPLKPARQQPLPGGRGIVGTVVSAGLNLFGKAKEVGSAAKTAVGNKFAAMKEKAEEKKAANAKKRAEQVNKGSRASLLSRLNEEQDRKDTKAYRTKVVNLLQRNADSSEEHKGLFSGIFGKKGLITAGVLLLLPIFIKLFKNLKLGELLKDLATTVTTGWSEIGGIKGLLANLGEKTDQATDVINGTDTHAKVDENGNLVTDENGNPVMETTSGSRLKQLLTPTKTRVNTETGKWEQRNEWTQMSGATVNYLGHKAISAGKTITKVADSKLGRAAIGGVKKLGAKISNSTPVVAAYTYADDALKAGARGVKSWIQSGRDLNALKKAGSAFADQAGIGQKVAAKATGFVDDAIDLGKKAVKSDVVQTFIKKAMEGLNFLVGKLAGVGQKFGLKVPVSSFDDILKMISTKVLNPKSLSGFGTKISEFLMKLTGKSSAAAATLFLAEIGFTLYGAIDGAVNAGALFEVNPDDVDAKMRAISAVFKGLMNTTAGSVVDFVNSLVYEITGMNFVKVIATWTYKLLSNDEDAKAIEAAQADFTKGYEDYVQEEYDAYVKGQEAKGEAAMSLDDFKASNLSTTRSEYNSKTNKSLFRRAVDGVKNITKLPGAIKDGAKKVGTTIANGAKSVKNFFVGSKEDVFMKEDGSYYVATKNGYDYYGADGKVLYKDVSADSVNAMVQSGQVTQQTRQTKSGISQLGGKLVDGVKGVGSKISGGVKSVVGKVKDSNFGQGVTAVVDKTKELFGNVGDAVGNVAKNGIDAAKGMATGWQTIAANFYNKDNSFMDYFKADVNPLGEDNMFHGVVGGILNVSKVVMFPKLLVAGIMKKVGTAIKDAVGKIVDDAKIAVTDYATNSTKINQLAFSGDLDGLRGVEITTSEDNPIGGIVGGLLGVNKVLHYPVAFFVGMGKKIGAAIKGAIAKVVQTGQAIVTNQASITQLALTGDTEGLGNYAGLPEDSSPVAGFANGLLGVQKVMMTPLAYVVKAGRFIVGKVKGAINAVKQTGVAIVTNQAAIGQLALSGDTDGLSDYAGLDENSSPVAGFANGLLGVQKAVFTPIAYVVKSGKFVVEKVKGAISTVKETGVAIGTGTAQISSMAFSGNVDGLHDYEGVDPNSSPLAGFANGLLGVQKTMMTPIAYVVKGGKDLVGAIKGAIGKVVDYGAKTKTFVTTLNSYADPDKSLSGWDNETMATGDDDAIGHVLSTVIKKVMWVYVGIVRNVKKMFDWIGDAAEGIKEGVSGAWDNVKEGAGNAWDWVKDKANGIGTAIMDLGRGGLNGGRPIAGGKGGETQVMNGMPYYSQNDPAYKNIQYKQTGGFGQPVGDTIGDSGCGPTAMAMVASKYAGDGYTPPVMSKMAEAGGYSTSVGTSPGYFSAAGDALGIPNQQVAPTKDSLETTLGSGGSVIMQGISGGAGGDGGVNSPYTDEGHYVTATGISGDRVLINDPRGPEYSGEYRTKDVLHDTTGMWSFGAAPGGFGARMKRKFKTLRGGKAGVDKTKWIQIINAVKQAIAAQKPGYSQSRYITITVGGKSMKCRTDCSGYVQTCLKYYGVMPEGTNISSANVKNAGDATMKNTGFTPGGWPGWEGLQEGDVLGTSGHTEIFAWNKNGKHYVYNCGSDSSTNSPVPTVSGHSSYQCVWRVGNAGTGVVSSTDVSGASADGGSYSGGDSSSSTSSSSGGFSSFADLLGGLADAATKPILKAFGLTTDDSSSTSTSGGNYSGDSSSGGDSGVTAANVSGSNTAQQVWNFFTSKGYSKHGTAGIMGNMQAESGMYPQRLQGDFTKGYTKSQEYTKATDSGSNNFVHDSKGYGLVQFTYHSLKKQLLDAAKSNGKSVGDTGLQLSVVDNMLRTSYPSVYNTIKNATDVKTASNSMLHGYERPKDQSAAVENKRASLGMGFYNTYAGGKGGSLGGRPLRNIKPIRQVKALPSLPGGRGSAVLGVSGTLRDAVTQTKDPTAQIIERNNIINNGADTRDLAQLFKAGLEYLAQITTNTGDTAKGIISLNEKDFGGYNQVNNTTNNVDNSQKSYNQGNDNSVADRSEYALAKRVAMGIVD